MLRFWMWIIIGRRVNGEELDKVTASIAKIKCRILPFKLQWAPILSKIRCGCSSIDKSMKNFILSNWLLLKISPQLSHFIEVGSLSLFFLTFIVDPNEQINRYWWLNKEWYLFWSSSFIFDGLKTRLLLIWLRKRIKSLIPWYDIRCSRSILVNLPKYSSLQDEYMLGVIILLFIFALNLCSSNNISSSIWVEYFSTDWEEFLATGWITVR